LKSGALFAGYRIQRLLGAGGMGEVYLAQHPRLPRLDAIKILPASLTNNMEFRQRFNREADLAATLYHPHIVGVHDRGEFDGQLWISMDFVDGTDAAQLVDDNPGTLAVSATLEVVEAVADALDFAHERRLLHRDVKPANILLTTPGACRGRILLADFGIARQADDISGLTSTNVVVGTVSYSAPEQLLGQGLDGRADLYALAATTYHLLVGRPPFVHTNPAVVISNHLNSPPPALSEARPEVAHLDSVLSRGLAKDPADRYSTCSDFATALHTADRHKVAASRAAIEASSSSPTSADRPSLPEQTMAAEAFAAMPTRAAEPTFANRSRLSRARFWWKSLAVVKKGAYIGYATLPAVAIVAATLMVLFGRASRINTDPQLPTEGSPQWSARCTDPDKIAPDPKGGSLFCDPGSRTWVSAPDTAAGLNVAGWSCEPGSRQSVSTDGYLIVCDQSSRRWTRWRPYSG
jgi:serine/threonine-protein kinase